MPDPGGVQDGAGSGAGAGAAGIGAGAFLTGALRFGAAFFFAFTFFGAAFIVFILRAGAAFFFATFFLVAFLFAFFAIIVLPFMRVENPSDPSPGPHCPETTYATRPSQAAQPTAAGHGAVLAGRSRTCGGHGPPVAQSINSTV